MELNREYIYDKVNECETLDELSGVIRELADENGMIRGRTRDFNAEYMAIKCENYSFLEYNTLTRQYGIRQQAMMILFQTNKKLQKQIMSL